MRAAMSSPSSHTSSYAMPEKRMKTESVSP